MQSKFFWGGCLTIASFLFCPTTAQADIGVRQVSIGQSQGTGGNDLPTLEISPLWGLTISFIKTNELVQQVRISDPARVLVDFDSPLAGGEPRSSQLGGQSRSLTGAAVIYLRQIGTPFKLPTRLTARAKKSSRLPLTVITTDRSNQRKLYQFLLVLGKDTKYSTVEIVPDSFFARPVILPAPPSPADLADQFGIGLALATKNNMVVAGSLVDRKLKVFQKILRTGSSIESAAQQSDVPLRVVNQIMQLKP